MIRIIERFLHPQKGQILALSALVFPMLMAIFAIAIEFGNIYMQQSRLQSAADAAALAGVTSYTAGYGNQSNGDLTKKAEQQMANLMNANINGATLQSKTITPTATATATNQYTVASTVTVTRAIQPVFKLTEEFIDDKQKLQARASAVQTFTFSDGVKSGVQQARLTS